METKITLESVGGQLIVREGEAPKINEPQPQKFIGHIGAPRRFFEIRKKQVLPEKAVVEYDIENVSITLYVDKSDLLAPIIEGKLIPNPELTAFKINSGNKFSVKELMNHLRMKRMYFVDKDENDKVVSGLMNYKANITTEIENNNALKGNKKELLEVKLSHALKLDFRLQIPVFKCEKPITFNVEIMCDVTDGDVKFWLESLEMEELIKAEKERVIVENVLPFNNNYVVIQK